MKTEKKIKRVWICFAIASITAVVGSIIHPLIFAVGMIGLAGVMGFCMIDR
ncbi:MAG: hypothetical protein LBL18_00450 [Bacteroidales bacterium]|jgi:hypothetical protein|nr:hypothetical protein [Bacteroidales bacterium]